MLKGLMDIVALKGVPGKLRLACFAVVGMAFGMGAYVAKISHSASYLSDDPRACINCHIMNPEYATWERSSHGPVTNCNDCHVPHDNVVRKYWFKANDGLRHSVLFTLRKERQVITAIPESKKVIQENCRRCHEKQLESAGTPIHTQFQGDCTSCHREIPHGRVHSLSSTPNAAVPPLTPVTPDWMRGNAGNFGLLKGRHEQ